MPMRMGVVFLCVMALSLVFIVEDEQQLVTQSQTADGRAANELEAVVVLSPTSLEETTSDPESEAARTTPPTPEATTEAQAPATDPPVTSLPTESTTATAPSDFATVPPTAAVAGPLELGPEPSESTAPPGETTETPVLETVTPVPVTTAPPSPTVTAAPSNSSIIVPLRPTTTPAATLGQHPPSYNASIDGDLAADFDCVGWRRTGQSSPNGPREPQHDRTCHTPIHGCISGYCVFRHKHSGELRRALLIWPNSMPCHIVIRCNSAGSLLHYGLDSTAYVHDAAFQLDGNKNSTLTRVFADITARQAAVGQEFQPPTVQNLNFDRGITMAIHEKVLGSAYISIRSLRALGSILPIELWYKQDEVKPDHPILKELVDKYGVFLREIVDPRATRYYTKLYAVFYSAFDHVLLLDADNFAVRDPTYLFDTPEYQETGAMFWPDFWRPAQSIFHIVREDLLWEVLGLTFVDMFEQESGQVLIDRRRHQSALNVLMYYGFSLPRVHETMEFEWGDKDLFRFAWMKTNSTFHYIARPPGCGGRYSEHKKKFCGVTMVQHDPQGDVVFLHRNQEKMVAGSGNKRVWTHIEQLKRDAPIDKYKPSYTNKIFPDMENCWGLDEATRDYFTMTPLTQFPFQNIETELLQYGELAGALLVTEPTPATEPPRWTPKPTKSPHWANHGRMPKPKGKQRTSLRQVH